MSNQKQERQEAARAQTESQAASTAHNVGVQAQASSVFDKKRNPQFYDKFTKTSISDSRKWSHLIDDHAVWMADDHILSNRRQVHRLQRELLNQTRAELSIVGASPGAHLRQKPLLNAICQGVHPDVDQVVPLTAAGQESIKITDKDFTPPMTSEKRTALDDLAGVATARQSMGVDQAGSEALTTATTEQRTVRDEETEKTGFMAGIGGIFD